MEGNPKPTSLLKQRTPPSYTSTVASI
jgi:hypothetical protein